MKRQSILIVACAFFLGCQMPGMPGRRDQAATPGPDAGSLSAHDGQNPSAPTEGRGFSFKRMLQFAGFNRDADQEVSVMPQELGKLQDLISTVVAKAGELRAEDPAEVTQQKAQAILEALRPWDSLLEAGRSLGIVNENNSQILNGLVLQLKSQTQKLIQHGANPETIAAVQHLARNVKSTFGGITGVFNQGMTAYRNFAGGTQHR